MKTVDYMFQSVVRQIYAFFSPFFHFWPDYVVPKIVVSLLILTLIGPIFAAARRLFARERLLALLLDFPVLLWLGYSWIAPPLDHYWYLTPGTYFLLAARAAVLGRGHAARAPRGRASPPAPALLGRVLRALPAAALVLVTLIFMPQKLDAHAQRWMVSSFYRARTGVYLTLARWIKDVRLADVSVLMHEPGYFAYWSGSPMIDAAGLITKGIYYHGPEERRTKPDDIVRVHRPGMIVTPPLYWFGLTLDDYLPLYYPVPARILYVRRSIFTERYPALAEHWLARDAYHPDHPALLRHPLHWNFERGVDSGWVTGGSITDFVGQPRPVQFGRRPVTEDYLNTAGPRGLWASVSSPPFMIDFDEISFRFGGTDRNYTRARLIVDGQIVLEQGGDGKRLLQMHDVFWPVWSWKGKVGVLQFDDADIEDGFLAADHVQTSRYDQFSALDDFESDGAYGAFWETSFGAAPSELEPLARRTRPRHAGRPSRGAQSWRGRRRIGRDAQSPVHDRARWTVVRDVRLRWRQHPDRSARGRRGQAILVGREDRTASGRGLGRQGAPGTAGRARDRRRGARRRRVDRHRRRRDLRSRRRRVTPAPSEQDELVDDLGRHVRTSMVAPPTTPPSIGRCATAMRNMAPAGARAGGRNIK